MHAIGHGGPRTQAGLEWPAPVIVLEALARFIPPETIQSGLTQTGRQDQRIRRLPATAVVWLVIAIGIWTDLDIPATVSVTDWSPPCWMRPFIRRKSWLCSTTGDGESKSSAVSIAPPTRGDATRKRRTF